MFVILKDSESRVPMLLETNLVYYDNDIKSLFVEIDQDCRGVSVVMSEDTAVKIVEDFGFHVLTGSNQQKVLDLRGYESVFESEEDDEEDY